MSEPVFLSRKCPYCGGDGRVVNPAWLRERRLLAEMSLRDMAKTLNVSAPYLSDIERGNRAVPAGFREAYDELRRRGKTKLVYNKATRSIDEVKVRP